MRYDGDVLFGCKGEVHIKDFPKCLCTLPSVLAALMQMCACLLILLLDKKKKESVTERSQAKS